MGRRDFRRALGVVLGTGALFSIVLGLFALTLFRYPDKPTGTAVGPVMVTVERGMSLGQLARRLEHSRLIRHPLWFRLYANERGLAHKIRAGHYNFQGGMTPRQLLDQLVEGVPDEEVSVTVPEGKNSVEIAAILERAGICSAQAALKLIRDATFATRLGVPGKTLEGYLFPDTYRFAHHTDAMKVLALMVKRTQEVYGELKADHAAEFATLQTRYKFSDRDVVTMASLIEKETARAEERPRIAAVFFNRLRLPTFVPHRLQTDPTIVYGCTALVNVSSACEKFEGRIRRIHLEDRDNPYNTYTHDGLPPGPIASPGRASLQAVFSPDDVEDLYFVSRNDGTHQFSKTRAEHEAAVNRFQRHGGQ